MSKSYSTIWYVTSLKIPTIWAHGVQIMKMCEALSEAGVKMGLFAQRSHVLSEDPFAFYAVSGSFDILYLQCRVTIFEKISIPQWQWVMRTFGFGRALLAFIKKEKELPDFFYAREYALLPFLKKIGASPGAGRPRVPIFFESHTAPGFFSRYFLKSALPLLAGVGATTSYVRDMLVRCGVPASKIILLPDGFSEKDFPAVTRPPEEFRRELGLPLDKKIIMYTGHLFRWKGVYTLAEASRYLGNKIPYEIVIIGGHEPDCTALLRFINANKLTNIRVIPRQEYRNIVSYLHAADVFVLPNSAEEAISRLYTSPIKMFEYMASGCPIVASDLPSIREILDEKNAVLVRPDDSQDLARGIVSVLEDPSKGRAIAEEALIRSKEYTWRKRAEKVMRYLERV